MLSQWNHNGAEDEWLRLLDNLEECGNSNETAAARLRNNKVSDTQEILHFS